MLLAKHTHTHTPKTKKCAKKLSYQQRSWLTVIEHCHSLTDNQCPIDQHHQQQQNRGDRWSNFNLRTSKQHFMRSTSKTSGGTFLSTLPPLLPLPSLFLHRLTFQAMEKRMDKKEINHKEKLPLLCNNLCGTFAVN